MIVFLAKRNVSWGFGGCREAVPFFADDLNPSGEYEGWTFILYGEIQVEICPIIRGANAG